MYCPNCDSEVKSSVRVISETYPVKGEDITIEAHVRFCDCCGNDLWDENLDAQNLLDAFAEYRKRHNLLQPADIRATREKYGLSQTVFARVLGFGDKTITRYENGSIADAAQNNLIMLVNPAILHIYWRRTRKRFLLLIMRQPLLHWTSFVAVLSIRILRKLTHTLQMKELNIL